MRPLPVGDHGRNRAARQPPLPAAVGVHHVHLEVPLRLVTRCAHEAILLPFGDQIG